MKRKRLVWVGVTLLFVLAAPFMIAQFIPAMTIPGATVRRSSGAASIYMFAGTPTARVVEASLVGEGWARQPDAVGQVTSFPDSTKEWLLIFKRGTDHLTVYSQAELIEGSKRETGTVGMVWHKPALPEFFYVFRSFFSPQVTLNLSPGKGP